MHKALMIPMALLMAIGCKNRSAPDLRGFPEKKDLDSSMRTVFVPVPDHPGEPGDNIIYAASFKLAWNELCRILDSDLGSVQPVIRRLNAARAEPAPLQESEYGKSAEVAGDELIVRADFHRNLPFAVPFEVVEEGLVFAKKSTVKAFGMTHFNDALADQVEVLYYENDDQFVIRLHAGPEQDEMLLAKGFTDGVKLSTMHSRVQAAIQKGKKEKAKKKHPWKFFIGEQDQVQVPKLRFHLETGYAELTHQPVAVKGNTLHITEALQRTAFVLDEQGVILESEAVIAVVDSVAAVPQPVKHLIFDEPFLIVMKTRAAENPYFIMKVANAELMEVVGKRQLPRTH